MSDFKKFGILLVIAVVLVAVLNLIPKQDNGKTADYSDIKSFMDCAEAGYPISESFPAQCRLPNGQVFTEDINEQPEVVMDNPRVGDVVASPLVVTGLAKNTWFFEANIPLTLKDSNGKVLAQTGGQALTDWMTEGYVDFIGTLEFSQPETEFGVLLIQKDNPSALPENDASYAVPVKFR